MITITMPYVGAVRAAAQHLVRESRTLNCDVESEFNGTPMMAYRSDNVDQIVMRWHYERLLIQIATGVVDIKDYADRRYL